MVQRKFETKRGILPHKKEKSFIMEKQIEKCVKVIVSNVAEFMEQAQLPIDFEQAKEVAKALGLVQGIRGREGGMAPTVKGARWAKQDEVHTYLVKQNAEKVIGLKDAQRNLTAQVDALSVAVTALGNNPAAKVLQAQLAEKETELSSLDKSIAQFS